MGFNTSQYDLCWFGKEKCKSQEVEISYFENRMIPVYKSGKRKGTC